MKKLYINNIDDDKNNDNNINKNNNKSPPMPVPRPDEKLGTCDPDDGSYSGLQVKRIVNELEDQQNFRYVKCPQGGGTNH